MCVKVFNRKKSLSPKPDIDRLETRKLFRMKKQLFTKISSKLEIIVI